MARGFALHRHWPEAIVIYPQGLPVSSFYDPEGRRSGWAKNPGENRDLAFFDKLLKYAKKKWRVDENRIHATGHSNGGGFTYLLLFERGGHLSSVAPSSAGVSRDLRGRKPVSRPIFHLIGERDRIVPPEWQDPVIEKIKEYHDCGPGKKWKDHAQCMEFPSAKGAPLVVYRHPGGHRMPGDSAELIAAFLRQHPKNEEGEKVHEKGSLQATP
ncbi:MAG: dienelactone hydrolase family protein [Roseibacillus sp.]|jgi:polyhydroxybutyrate depolymerase|nr:esterase [Roseibacillus sp.]MDP7307161.1 dienelactone hydrolase family protein [Roseibacillus sp.]MDP7654683.1 dienelactone hydrolase family protein [Roseibacillus sp.]HJM65359.1 hypothetical protein [Roseibacillus sp.]